jgi:2-amino-4-hydroxy-6-hydroxymethyldihydropteridine diphosphokinase
VPVRSIVAYIGLGSNLGDKMSALSGAVDSLAGSDGVDVDGLSPVYRTEPVGYIAQDDFVNMVVRITTSLAPDELLKTCLAIEDRLGRERSQHKGPRTIDLDILLYGTEVIETESLTVPHKCIREREFVLRPLFDLDPDIELPPDSARVRDLLEAVAGHKRVDVIYSTMKIDGVA